MYNHILYRSDTLYIHPLYMLRPCLHDQHSHDRGFRFQYAFLKARFYILYNKSLHRTSLYRYNLSLQRFLVRILLPCDRVSRSLLCKSDLHHSYMYIRHNRLRCRLHLYVRLLRNCVRGHLHSCQHMYVLHRSCMCMWYNPSLHM